MNSWERKVINIAENEHFADYAMRNCEYQRGPRKSPNDGPWNLFCGLTLICLGAAALYAFIYVGGTILEVFR